MSFSVLTWAFEQVMPSSHSHVLKFLASSVNDKYGCAWPSQPLIAARSNGIHVSTAKRCLDDLEQLRVLTRGWRRIEGRKVFAYKIDTNRAIYWKKSKSGCSWKDYIRAEKAKFAANELLPGETKKDFKERQLSRLKTGSTR
ncbi:MAG: helix-turn-helix domain-containing protein [Hyphomonadaceae bacterium]